MCDLGGGACSADVNWSSESRRPHLDFPPMTDDIFFCEMTPCDVLVESFNI